MEKVNEYKRLAVEASVIAEYYASHGRVEDADRAMRLAIHYSKMWREHLRTLWRNKQH